MYATAQCLLVYWLRKPLGFKESSFGLVSSLYLCEEQLHYSKSCNLRWKGEKDIISLLGDDMFHQIFAHLRNDGGYVSLLRRRYFYQHVIEQQLMTSRINLISPHHMLQVRIVNIKFWAAGLITAPYFHLSPANCSFKGRGCHICGLCTPS